MAHTAALVEVLKRELKTRGVTYADLAKQLRLSEASVKRMFSRRDFTLRRFDEICRHAQIDFSELARAMVRDETLISHLTPEQEKEIVADRKLFLVAVCALNQVTFDQIVETYAISTAECVQLLARLDKLKFIELQPGNRIKLLVSRTFSWLPDGPIQRFFNDQARWPAISLFNLITLHPQLRTYPPMYPLRWTWRGIFARALIAALALGTVTAGLSGCATSHAEVASTSIPGVFPKPAPKPVPPPPAKPEAKPEAKKPAPKPPPKPAPNGDRGVETLGPADSDTKLGVDPGPLLAGGSAWPRPRPYRPPAAVTGGGGGKTTGKGATRPPPSSSGPQPDDLNGRVARAQQYFSKLKEGTYTFAPPSPIKVDEWRTIGVAASIKKDAQELEKMLRQIVPDAGRMESVGGKVGPMMEAKLTGESFDIKAVSPASQTIAEDAAARWLWEVKAKEPGKRRLHLVVTAIIPDGSAPPTEVALMNRDIEVEVTIWWLVDHYWEKYWKWLLGGLGTAAGSAIAWFFNRKRKEPTQAPTPAAATSK
jgi:hypothetical protein